MGGSTVTADGVAGAERGQGSGNNYPVHSLASHAAIHQHGSGVDPSVLADFIMSMARMSASRVMGIGAEQYGGKVQKFELMSPSEIYEALLEEVADIFAYASFLAIKAGAAK